MNAPEPSRVRIEALIAAYGADPARWPASERALLDAARDCAAADLDQAAALDALLDTWQAPPPRAALRRAVLHAVARTPRESRRGLIESLADLWRELGGARVAAPALSLALALGLGLGWATAPDAWPDAAPEDVLVLVQFEDAYAEYTP